MHIKIYTGKSNKNNFKEMLPSESPRIIGKEKLGKQSQNLTNMLPRIIGK